MLSTSGAKFVPRAAVVDAAFYEEAHTVEFGAVAVDVPAGHWCVVMPGAVVVLSDDDFVCLFEPKKGHVVRSYRS